MQAASFAILGKSSLQGIREHHCFFETQRPISGWVSGHDGNILPRSKKQAAAIPAATWNSIPSCILGWVFPHATYTCLSSTLADRDKAAMPCDIGYHLDNNHYEYPKYLL